MAEPTPLVPAVFAATGELKAVLRSPIEDFRFCRNWAPLKRVVGVGVKRVRSGASACVELFCRLRFWVDGACSVFLALVCLGCELGGGRAGVGVGLGVGVVGVLFWGSW